MRKIVLLVIIGLLLTACQVVPTTGDTANDVAAAQNYLPNLPGYTVTEGSSVTDALTKVGAGASFFSGNLPMAALIAKLNDTFSCYQQVGAVAARVYTEQDVVGAATRGSIPKIGVLGIVNTTRVQRNLFNCVLNTGAGAQAQAQTETIQPCGGSGSFTVNNENLQYVYVATAPDLCATFQAAMPRQ